MYVQSAQRQQRKGVPGFLGGQKELDKGDIGDRGFLPLKPKPGLSGAPGTVATPSHPTSAPFDFHTADLR